MNPDPLEKIFRPTSTVKLDEKKKDAMHQEILLFMKRNPFVKGNVKKGWLGFSVPNIGSFKLKTPGVVLVGMMLFLLVGGIASVKADTALPGDLFYPIKIGFNEKIEEALAFSDKAKLNLNIKLAELRLQEAEQLALKGKLSSNDEVQINKNFQNHAMKASVYVSQLSKKGDDKKLEAISADFEASLRAHSLIINGLQKNTINQTTSPFVSDIDSITSKISVINVNTNNTLGATEKPFNKDKERVIREKISAVENSVNMIKKLIENNKVKIGAQAVSQSEDNLNLVQEKINEGKSQIENNNNDYPSSAFSLQQASVIAQESKDLIDAKTNLGINIPINIPSQDNAVDEHSQNKQSNQDNQGTKSGNVKTKVKDSLKIDNILK